MSKYAIGYKGKESIIEADSKYQAVLQAEKLYKPTKKDYYMLHVFPCNENGEVNGSNC